MKKARFDAMSIEQELQQTGECTRNIQPSPNILNIFKNSGYSTEEASSDIIDNSVDAEAKNIWFDIEKDPHNKNCYRIRFADDGTGMNSTTLFGGLVIAASEPELQNKTKNKDEDLGKYGTGWNSSLSDLEPEEVIVNTKLKLEKLIGTIYSSDELTKNNWDLKTYIEKDKDIIDDFKKDIGDNGTLQRLNKISAFPESNNLEEVISIVRTALSRRFHRFIRAGIKFHVNGKKIIGEDLNGYDIPFRDPSDFSKNAETHTSEKVFDESYDAKEINSYIDNQEHKVPDTASIRVRAFRKPGLDILKKGSWTKYYGWNMKEAGVVVYRNNRMIQSKSWLGFQDGPDSYLSRFGLEVNFTSCLDTYMGCDYRKTKSIPQEYLVKMLGEKIKLLMKQARDEYKRHNTTLHGKGLKTNLDKVIKAIHKWFRDNNSILPKLPPVTREPQNTGTGKPRGKYKQRQVSDKITFVYRNDMDNKIYETYTSSKHTNCCEIHWNINHVFFTEFVEKVDENILFSHIAIIVAEHWSKEQSKPDGVKELEKFYDRIDTMDDLKGEWMEKMWPRV
jgi:hypothetical protein